MRKVTCVLWSGFLIAIFAIIVPSYSKGDFVWNGKGGDQLWSNENNWDGKFKPASAYGNTIVISGIGKQINENDIQDNMKLSALLFGDPDSLDANPIATVKGKSLQFGGDNSTIVTRQGTGGAEVQNPLVLDTDLVANVVASSLLISGNISQTNTAARSLRKKSDNTLKLSGSNTYTGGTFVEKGKLVVKGDSPTGTGDVDIAAGAELEADGKVTIGGKVSLGNGAIFQPAASSTAPFTINGSLTMTNAKMNFWIDTDEGLASQVVLNGIKFSTFRLGGTIDILGDPAPGSYTLFKYQKVMDFIKDDITLTLLGENDPRLSLDTSVAGEVNLKVTPEPTTGIMLVLGAFILVTRRFPRFPR
jgi:autotransporter-associated beta strand protein